MFGEWRREERLQLPYDPDVLLEQMGGAAQPRRGDAERLASIVRSEVEELFSHPI